MEQGVLGIDLGSTSVRVAIVTLRTLCTHYVINHKNRNSRSRLNLSEFSSNGYPFDDSSSAVYVGEEIQASRKSTSLKYAFYILARLSEDLLSQYELAGDLIARKSDPVLLENLRRGLVAMFHRLRLRTNEVCTNRRMEITTISLSIPSQWTLEFEDVYRDIVAEAFQFQPENIVFVTETQAMAHCLFEDAPEQFLPLDPDQTHSTVLFLDFGGHNMNSCFVYVEHIPGSSLRSYTKENAKGVAGGSEFWEYLFAKRCLKILASMAVGSSACSNGLPAQHEYYILDHFNSYKRTFSSYSSRQFYYHGSEHGFADVSLPVETVQRCLEKALDGPLDLAKAQIRKLAESQATNPRIVVSGGTSMHSYVREQLTSLCEEFLPEGKNPIWAEDFDINYHSMRIAKGAALATAIRKTPQEFMEAGAAISVQMRQKPKGQKLKDDDPWDEYGLRVLSNQYQHEFSITANGEEFRLQCDPFFEKRNQGDDRMHHCHCYILADLGKLPQGRWRINLSMKGSGNSMSMVVEAFYQPYKKKRRRSWHCRRVVPLYYSIGTNCIHLTSENHDGGGESLGTSLRNIAGPLRSEAHLIDENETPGEEDAPAADGELMSIDEGEANANKEALTASNFEIEPQAVNPPSTVPEEANVDVPWRNGDHVSIVSRTQPPSTTQRIQIQPPRDEFCYTKYDGMIYGRDYGLSSATGHVQSPETQPGQRSSPRSATVKKKMYARRTPRAGRKDDAEIPAQRNRRKRKENTRKNASR